MMNFDLNAYYLSLSHQFLDVPTLDWFQYQWFHLSQNFNLINQNLLIQLEKN